MKNFILSVLFLTSLTTYGEQVLQSRERKMMVAEKNIVDMIQKYHDDERFDSQVISLRNVNTETKDFTSISITLKSTTNPEYIYEYNALTRFVQFNKTEGRGLEVDGYYMLTNDDLFKHERRCGVSACESIIYKNGKKIYPQ